MTKIIKFKKSKGKKKCIRCFLQHQTLKSKICINHDGYCYHVKQFILASENSYCNFHILFIYYVLYFPLRTTALYFSCFSFFFIDCTWKQVLSILQAIHSCFTKGRSWVSTNVQTETEENEERYTLSNIIYIAFRNSYSFLWSFPS